MAEHLGAEGLAVHRAVLDRARKSRCDRLDRGAARSLKLVHFGVGVIDRRALGREHGRGGGFAHAD